MDYMEVFMPFANSSKDIIKTMTGIELKEDGECYEESDDLLSLGVTVAVSFVGKIKGRMLLDFDTSTAINLANAVTGENFTELQDEMVIASLSEIGNIVAGDAVTKLNNQFNSGSRLAPPILFSGKDVMIGTNNMQSFSAMFVCECGKVKVNVAYEGN